MWFLLSGFLVLVVVGDWRAEEDGSLYICVKQGCVVMRMRMVMIHGEGRGIKGVAVLLSTCWLVGARMLKSAST